MAEAVFAIACLVLVYALYTLGHGTATFGGGLVLLFAILVCEKLIARTPRRHR